MVAKIVVYVADENSMNFTLCLWTQQNKSSDKIYEIINLMTKLQSFSNLFKRFSFNIFFGNSLNAWDRGVLRGLCSKFFPIENVFQFTMDFKKISNHPSISVQILFLLFGLLDSIKFPNSLTLSQNRIQKLMQIKHKGDH